jgi:3',5'-cyclic AMP phosphodiesterase CpdA
VDIVQISDLHVTADEGSTRRFVDTNASLHVAVDALNALSVRPDLVLATGDLTDHGTPEDYALLMAALRRLELPLYLLPGNHDDVRVLAEELGGELGYLPASGDHLSYVIDEYAVRIVMLDTTDPERHDGVFPRTRAEWLDAVLRAAPERPTMVAMHHPPFDTGIWWMDVVGLEGRARFEAVIRSHPQVVRVVCGHIHRPGFTGWGSAVVSICPSTAHQVQFDLDPAAHPRMTRETPAYQSHRYADGAFVTNTVPFVVPGDVLDLTQFMASWAQARERLAAGGPFPKSGAFS